MTPYETVLKRDGWEIVKGPTPFNGRPGQMWIYDPRPSRDHYSMQHIHVQEWRSAVNSFEISFADRPAQVEREASSRRWTCTECMEQVPEEIAAAFDLLRMGK